MPRSIQLQFLFFLSLLVAFPSCARAQATRTWVSGVGDDANPCSRTAPCKTFAGAISKTAAGGEIDVLDPGGFGAVTITKSITIDGGGTFASILATGTNGVVVSAGAADKVVLRNLSIAGAGSGLNGVLFNSGALLIVDHSYISGFANNGISIAPTAGAQTIISSSEIENNGTGVLFSTANSTGALTGTISNSIISRNGGTGLSAVVPAGKPSVDAVADRVVASLNGTGIATNGTTAFVLLSNSIVFANGTGVSQASAGTVLSFKNNVVNGNGTDGTPLTGANLN
ncbi:right-handed parallel beta-helix repeat-containing protein [Bradyrhizobium sp. SZCCHNRI3037]|uniref:right-handed parallel beta-helix repeat-containing protein n=1 Tax=Bradyrhizobium sp. SZCCHNRI3037 TaxID=3057290 RepID=UPI0029170323|nr:right-handed parallel beta-helix repeat-containing protein [Bradyrhizobium sp. SZCCHNRI3037]